MFSYFGGGVVWKKTMHINRNSSHIHCLWAILLFLCKLWVVVRDVTSVLLVVILFVPSYPWKNQCCPILPGSLIYMSKMSSLTCAHFYVCMKVMILSFSGNYILIEAWQFVPKNPIRINSHCPKSHWSVQDLWRKRHSRVFGGIRGQLPRETKILTKMVWGPRR